MHNERQTPSGRFLKTFLITIVIIVVFAFGFQVTDINLERPKEERRQAQLVNVLRALARPDLTTYEMERLAIDAAILVPCPARQFTIPDLSQPGPVIQLSRRCAEPGSEITVKGSNFEPGESVFLYFVPYAEEPAQEVQLPLTNQVVEVNQQGEFSFTVELRRGRTSEEPQKVRAIVNRRSGLPAPSEAVYDTIAKIIETIFLALIATTLGTILSVPVSFLAARNLMVQVTSSLGSLVTLLVVAPVGWFLGAWLFGLMGGLGVQLMTGAGLSAGLLLAGPVLLLAVHATGQSQTNWWNLARHYSLLVLGAIVVALVWGLIAGLGQHLGLGLASVLGPLDFLGEFLFTISDALEIFLPFIGALTGMSILISIVGPLSENFLRHNGSTLAGKVFTVVMGFLAGAILVGLMAAFVAWLYQLPNRDYSIGLPALIGGVLFGGLAVPLAPDRPIPTGLIIYYTSRTILNALRAIEPLIMAIVFVVWVGIGPFAGVLALTLHTIAALGKLYSEQVENISQGPIEAVTATGANRLQTIIYAVIPQIVPPYIAFTIYRWDINVRMSTIIGFAGGGGIGFLLQQNLNLLKYRQASVQMIAIAIVVATLDYISAKIREKII